MTNSALGKTVFNSGKMFSRLGQLGETIPKSCSLLNRLEARRKSHPAVTGTSVIVSLPKMSITFTAMV